MDKNRLFKSEKMVKELFKEEKEIKPEQLPPKSNFIEWYNTILRLAEIADRRYPVKGTFVWMPYGLKIMKNLIKEWDKMFQENGIEEVYFPLFVPIEFAEKNREWFEGFKKHIYSVVPISSEVEKERLILRPTGEPAMYPIFNLWIKDGKLPIRVYQTVSSFRYEGKTTHTMIRDREITYWYEIHTVHKTKEEAEEEVKKHIKINEYIWKENLCIPPIEVEKPPYEIFPGALSAVEFYNIMPNGALLENGSVNNLGQAYAKKFDLYYVDEKGEKNYCWQVCTGNGARYLVSVFALHGDERGLIIPPKISPIQAVIIPIIEKTYKREIIEESEKVKRLLTLNGIRTYFDEREDMTPGEKFYVWDMKGVPLRIEIGKREVSENYYMIFRRDTKERNKIKKNQFLDFVLSNLNKEIPENLYQKILDFYSNKIRYFTELNKALEWIDRDGVAKLNWCEKEECYKNLSSLETGVEPIGTLLGEKKKGNCIICGESTDKLTLIGKVY
jgi:prolyl-tRNA synthetase